MVGDILSKIWELVEYECQDGKCLMIHNIPNDSKLGALSLDHRDIGDAIVEELNKNCEIIQNQKTLIIRLQSHLDVLGSVNDKMTLKMFAFMQAKGVFDEWYERFKKELDNV